MLTADAASFCISEHRCTSVAPFVFGLMLALASARESRHRYVRTDDSRTCAS